MNDGSVGVIGAGIMGRGIAQVIAQTQRSVLLVDRSPELVERAIAAIRDRLARRVTQDRMTSKEMESTMDSIRPATRLDELKGSPLMIEAVYEDPQVKLQLLRELQPFCSKGSIVVSNTSAIPISLLSSAVTYPQRFMGMHFFNPVPVMTLVEVIKGISTSDETVEEIVSFSLAIGKTPVVVSDSPGFVANRLLMPMINEAVFVLSEGIASREDIDTVMKLGANHPMGPLELADLIGLDTCLHVMEALHSGLGEDKYRPAPMLRRMVEGGLLGRKTGKGFYEYGKSS